MEGARGTLQGKGIPLPNVLSCFMLTFVAHNGQWHAEHPEVLTPQCVSEHIHRQLPHKFHQQPRGQLLRAFSKYPVGNFLSPISTPASSFLVSSVGIWPVASCLLAPVQSILANFSNNKWATPAPFPLKSGTLFYPWRQWLLRTSANLYYLELSFTLQQFIPFDWLIILYIKLPPFELLCGFSLLTEDRMIQKIREYKYKTGG